MSCILFVSDDTSTSRAMEQFLVFQGHFVLTAKDPHELVDALQQWQVDVLILDMGRAQEEYEEALSTLQAYPLRMDTPVIFLTWAEASVRELIRPDQDGWLVKPIDLGSFEEKLQRTLGSNYHGSHQLSNQPLCCGPLILDLATFQAAVSGCRVRLTPTEFGILSHLMKRAGEVVAIQELLEAVWGYPIGLGNPVLVRVHIKNLRRKLGDHVEGKYRFIKTVPRHGYMVPNEPDVLSSSSAV